MKIVSLSVIVLFACCIIVTAQQTSYQKSDIITFEKKATISVKDVKSNWSPNIQNLEAPFPGTNSYRNFLQLKKQEIPEHDYIQPQSSLKIAGIQSDAPIVGRNFAGNPYNGRVPNDNDMAISNDGMLISVINSTMHIFDVEGDSLVEEMSLADFADTLALPASKYDPKVLYDPKQDKFIVFFLNGTDSNNTNIVVGFSETKDPTGKWHVYEITGNPFMDGTWSDYPIVAITDEEVFITVNLLNTGQPWQTGFVESLIWQVDKSSGYSGSTLSTQLYSGIQFGGKSIRNLCPIQGGSTTTGPNIYLLSNRNFDVENDTIFVLEITGTMQDVNTELIIDFEIADVEYGLSPDGRQANNTFLQTNDSRVLGGFLENDQLHFVGNSANVLTDTVLAGVYHGIIRNISGDRSIQGHIIGDTLLDFGYPNISYSGRHQDDMQAIITYNHTALTVFPGMSTTFWDRWKKYSDRLEVKAGNGYVNILAGAFERWGDYSGTQRRYNEPGKVWFSGFYGEPALGVFLPNRNETWIAELESPGSVGVGIEATEIKELIPSKAYPNPAYNSVNLEFELKESTFLNIAIYDLKGRLIKVLMEDRVKKGRNIFSFSTEPLANGNYIVAFTSGNRLLFNEQVAVQR